MISAPGGTVTFLFTDIEGSTRFARRDREAWENARQRHHAILRESIEAHHGFVIQIAGDAFCAACAPASDELLAALTAQRGLPRMKDGMKPDPSAAPAYIR